MAVLYWAVVAWVCAPPVLFALAWYKALATKERTSIGAWIALTIATASSLLPPIEFLAPETWGQYYSSTRYATMSINFFLCLGCAIAGATCQSEVRSPLGCTALALALFWVFAIGINSVA
jgi:hypothetical protein